MSHIEQPINGQSPTQRAGIVAAFACLGCVTFLFSVGSQAMEWFQLGWAERLAIYISLPLTLTFTILFGSRVHREMKSVARAGFLLAVSLLIFAGVFLFLGAVALFTLASMPLDRFHY